MSKDNADRGAVEIITPDECVEVRLRAIATIASACEELARALNMPITSVTINGNITSNAKYGLRMGKKAK
jgi:hypothetical protein